MTWTIFKCLKRHFQGVKNTKSKTLLLLLLFNIIIENILSGGFGQFSNTLMLIILNVIITYFSPDGAVVSTSH